MARTSLRRASAAVATALVALALLATAAQAAERSIVPVGPDPKWGCVQQDPPRVTFKGPHGVSRFTGRFKAIDMINDRRTKVRKRLERAHSDKARAALRARFYRLGATRGGLVACAAGDLKVPGVSRRTFAFFCLHGFVLPTAIVRGTCAVNLRPRGEPSNVHAASYDVNATYDQLDVTLQSECGDDGGAFEGAEHMRKIHPLYIVRCTSQDFPGLGPRFPVQESWDVLAMESETCNEIVAAEDCPPPRPSPRGDPPSEPRDPPANPQPDCIIMGMESETDNC